MMYIWNGQLKCIDDDILMHYGVPGMKWGRRKEIPQSTGIKNNHKQSAPVDDAARKEARKQKAKRAVKIGAAVVATAVAAYGAKKLHDVVRDKNLKLHIEKGRKIADAATNPLFDRIRIHTAMTGRLDDEYIRVHENIASFKYKEAVNNAYKNAKNDTFGQALKNVIQDERARRRR